jgi:hypothetical protein
MRPANSLNSHTGLGMLRLPRCTSERSWVRKRHCGMTSVRRPSRISSGCTTGGRSPMLRTGQKGRRQAGEIVHRQVWLKGERFLVLAVDMNEGPAAFRPPIRERDQPVAEEILRRLRRLTRLQIVRARHQLMPVGENPPCDERRVLQVAEPKRDVDAIADVVDETLGNQNLDAYVRIARLERGHQRTEQRVGNIRRRRQPQRPRYARLPVGDDILHRFAGFGAALRVFEHFRSEVGEPQVSRRAVEQADAELILQFGDPPAHRRNRHAEPARGGRKALSFDNFGKNDKRIEVGDVEVGHGAFQFWKFESRLCRLMPTNRPG